MDSGVKLSIIAAVASNRVIGRGGDLPWKLKDDMKRFKELTMGHTVIVGRKTHEAIVRRLGKLLPDRRTIVVTRNASYQTSGCEIAHSLKEALSKCKAGEEVFVIGGAELYQEALESAQKMYLTVVHANAEGDVFFPPFPENRRWHLLSSDGFHDADASNEFGFNFEVWECAERERTEGALVNLENARFSEQRAIMEELSKAGLCPFCPEQIQKIETEPVLKSGALWQVRKNRWPYQGAKTHLLLILNRHAEKLTELSGKEWLELLNLTQWIEKTYEIKGGALGLRFGDAKLNGATIAHLHLHFIAADPGAPDYQKVRFAMGPEPKQG